MHRCFLLTVLLIALTINLFGANGDSPWAPGMVLIEVEDNGSGSPIIDENGFVQTGWENLDRACIDLSINRWEQMIPIASDPEIQKRWKWTERWYKFYFDPEKSDVKTVVQTLSQLPGVKYVEPNYRNTLCATPNDPYYPAHQWYVDKINVNRVWDFTQGSEALILSGVDSGVDYLHPDLTNLIWQNLGEDANDNGYVFIPGVGFDEGDIDSIDNDGNGYIDDFIGYDWVDGAWYDAYRHPTDPDIREDAYEWDNDPKDFRYNGHGTHVTGTMTAEANNHIGIAGITWHTQIMCMRAGYYSRTCQGYNQNDAVVHALHYGVNKGCKIFNFSYGGNDSSHFVHSILDTAVNEWGVVITAAAGNDNTDSTHYPSAYPEVISVAATDQMDCKTYFSNFSPTVDIASPGNAIGATVPRYYECPPEPCDAGFTDPFAQGYAEFDGTSMAAPVVAGAAALVWSFYPDSSNHWVRQRLEENTVDIYSLGCNSAYEALEQLGSGRVDVFRAIGAGVFPQLHLDEVVAVDDDGDGRPEPGENVDLTITYSNTTDPIWADAINAEVILTCEDTLVEITDSVGYIGNIAIGASASNSTDPISFRMRSEYTYGYTVTFTANLRADEGYVHIGDFDLKVGFPEVLIATYDTNAVYLGKITSAIRWGGVPYDTLYIPREGLDSERMGKHRVIFLLSGKESGSGVLSSSNQSDLNSWLTSSTDRVLIMTGQDIAEAGDATWLSDLFSASHNDDSLGMSFGFNVTGIDGDEIGDGIYHENILFGGGSAGNQRSFGSCSAQGSAVPFFYYDFGDLADSTCAVRYEDADGWKSALIEFGLEGFGDSIRYVVTERLLRWADVQYFEDIDENLAIPTKLELLPPFPNPFNSMVGIGFVIPDNSAANVEIFDVRGNLIRNFDMGNIVAGPHLMRWDAKDIDGDQLPSGTYLYRVNTEFGSASGKLVFVK